MTRLGRLRSTVVVLVTAVAMFAGGVLMTRGGPVEPAEPSGRAGARVSETAGSADLSEAIVALQLRLRRLPDDHTAWATLGTTYVQQAAATGDPAYYPKAQGALRRSLRVEPRGNAAAQTGLASLAAARHDFVGALRHAREAHRINRFGATNLGVLSDALVQLGRYRESFAVLQRMLDLQPGVPALTRASYAWELRGRLRPARIALQRALDVANRPSDKAFCLYYLGELAWNSGRPLAADDYYTQGLAQDPSYAPLLAGRAKVAAATGATRVALRRYEAVVLRLPLPSHLIAYADLLRSLGREQAAARQYAVVRATQALLADEGVGTDPELAVLAADRGRPAASLRAARDVWRQQRGVDAADAYAWALHAADRDRGALRYARAAAQLGTRSALFAYHRGMIEKSLRMDAAARRSLRRALDLNPYFSPLHAPRAAAALDAVTDR